jgi:hypothetical protein
MRWMEAKSRTIDNLGIQASIDYAKNLELYDSSFIEESRLIPQKTEIASIRPYIPSEVDAFFNPARESSWALFTPPPNYFTYNKALFSYQLVPSLGSQEKQQADADKLEQLEDYLDKRRGKEGKNERERDEEEEERETLLAMFHCLRRLDKTLGLINSRRNQYQRG